MFTGLVERKGTLARRSRRGPGYRLAIAAELGELVLGESISVSGACLTVVSFDGSGFEADVSLETTSKTTLGSLALGSAVNLERALKVGDRLGGHIVAGHVDAVAELVRIAPAGEAQRLSIAYPRELSRFIAPKGSITLDGVSLTVSSELASQSVLSRLRQTAAAAQGPLLLGIAYFLGAQAAFLIGTLSDQIFALFWPPNVILFFALMVVPQRDWWVYIAAAFPAHALAELGVGMPVPQLLVAFATNCMVALLNAGSP